MTNMEKIKPGQHYGKWEVLGPAEKPYYVQCRCMGCGKIQNVLASALLNGKTFQCRECFYKKERGVSRDHLTEKNVEKYKKEYIGKIINGFLVTDIFSVMRKHGKAMGCRYVCAKCGKESTTMLARLKKITHCANCNRDIEKKTSTINSESKIDGSDLYSVKSRTNNQTVNRNSQTGYNGVSPLKNGRYRAYINFQRKQYSLGFYDSAEDAAAARKKAEKIIYQPYLEKNAGWEERVKESLNQLIQDEKKDEKSSSQLKKTAYRKCSQCGKLYWTKSKDSYMCEDCAKAVKSSSVLRTRVCARCGAEFEGYPRSKYCPQCKPEVEREQAAERRKHKPRKIGSEDICEACGKPYIVKSGLQKYCPDCAKTVVPETIREHKREYMAEHSEAFNAAREEKRNGRLICKVCGKPFESLAPGAQTCSPECAEILKKQAQKRADKKRSPRPPRKKSVEK